MNTLKRAINFILVATYVLSASVFYGCGADSLGPYQPFDGLRWDISFAQEHHLFSLIHSRISNPIQLSDDAPGQVLGRDLGRRNGLNATSGVSPQSEIRPTR